MKCLICEKDFVTCAICGKNLKMITESHLRTHGITVKEYKVKFPHAELLSNALKEKRNLNVSKTLKEKWKNDERFRSRMRAAYSKRSLNKKWLTNMKRAAEKRKSNVEWRQSMRANHWSKRGFSPWNKGLTKETDERVKVIAEHIDVALKKFRKNNPQQYKRNIQKMVNASVEKWHTKKDKILNHSIRSSWERVVAYWVRYILNMNYQYEKRVDLANGKMYFPDFYLEDIDAYIEVKGWGVQSRCKKPIELGKIADIVIIDGHSYPWIKEQVEELLCIGNMMK